MNKRKLLNTTVIVLICTSLWFYRYCSFNSRIAEYYTAERKYYSMDEYVEYDENIINLHSYKGCSLKLNKAQIITHEDFCRQFDLLEMYQIIKDENIPTANAKICLMELEFKNNSKRTYTFDIGDLSLFGKEKELYQSAFVFSINPELDLNKTSSILIESETSKTFLVPFLLYEDGFSKKEWERIETYPLFLFVTQFPQERVIVVGYT